MWYSVTDKITYIPGMYTGKLTFSAAFHDLPDGLQTHILAPTGLDMKGRWTLGGSLPGEPRQPVELGLGLPKTGLYLREDVELKVNMLATGFVKKSTKKAHSTLVQRMIEKSHLKDNEAYNTALNEQFELRNSIPPDYHASLATSPVPQGCGDQKPPLNSEPSWSTAGRASVMSGHGIEDPRHPYYKTKPGLPRANSANHPYYAAPVSPPLPQQHSPYQSYSPPEMPVHQPYTNQLHTNIAAELPAQEARTPIEMNNARTPR